jgi:hypothetical protein
VKTGDYEFSYQLPDVGGCNLGNVSVNDHAEPVRIDVNECSTHPYTVFVSNLDFNGTGEYCFGNIFVIMNILDIHSPIHILLSLKARLHSQFSLRF